ncbi:DUF4189 domain-containing protein [Marinicauda salina]|uniref:DUF4189 domain-containing protein n=1 Tax=Marinicauda salina TaxID=2135793 RepID=UPI0011B2594D|nr:DUF4189 domain-containing protein [Marinicauda salina]
MSKFIASLLLGMLALGGTAFIAPSAAAAPNPCEPILAEPENNAAVTPRFDIRIFVDGSIEGCDVDGINLRVFEAESGRQVYADTSDCCQSYSTETPIVDMTMPEGSTRPDTRYNIHVALRDDARGLSFGTDSFSDQLSAPAVVTVTTSESLYRTARQPQQGLDAMVFAVDRRGRYGHAKAPDPEAARRSALEFCGNSDCEVIDEPVRARCHALAQRTEGGYWWGVGTGSSETDATANARRFCERAAPGGCEIDYSYCQ